MDHLADAPIANILILAGVIFLAVALFGRIGGFIGSIFGNIEAGQNSRVLAGVLGGLLIVGGSWMHQDSHKSAASTPGPAALVTTASVTPTVSPAPSAAPTTTVTPPTNAPATNAPSATPGTTTTRPVTPNTARDPKPAVPAPRPAPNTQLTTSVAPSTPVPAADTEKVPAPAPAPVFDNRLVGTWTNLTPQSDSIKRIEFTRVGQSLGAHLWYSCPPSDCDVGTFPVTISGTAPVFEYNGNGRRRAGTLNLHTRDVLLLAMEISGPAAGERLHHNWVMVKSTLSEKTRDAFSRYFGKSRHKAFALGAGGGWSYHFSDASSNHAQQLALDNCEKHGVRDCRVILVDDDPK
jgi:hypothetical protein